MKYQAGGGYLLNTEKSSCTNDATYEYKRAAGVMSVTNITKSGTKCTFYFDIGSSDVTLAKLQELNSSITVNTTTPNFSKTATTDEGIFAAEDDDGTSYYWRGAATTNYLTFAGFCWRIVRINGNGTIRLLYDGTTCHANGTSTTDSIAVSSVAYSSSSNASYYVGWTYEVNLQRPSNTNNDGTVGVSSNAKTKTEEWYNSNLASYDSQIASGSFCNDRTVGSGSWSSSGTTFYYQAYTRLGTSRNPELTCSHPGDIYSTKVGLITADEAYMAGGVWSTSNTSYYVYDGQVFWTMTPYTWTLESATNYNPGVIPEAGGTIYSSSWAVGNRYGIRPVINLNPGAQIASGSGSLSDPFIVS